MIREGARIGRIRLESYSISYIRNEQILAIHINDYDKQRFEFSFANCISRKNWQEQSYEELKKKMKEIEEKLFAGEWIEVKSGQINTFAKRYRITIKDQVWFCYEELL